MKSHKLYKGVNRQLVKICMPVAIAGIVAFGTPATAQQKSFRVSDQTNPLKTYAVPSGSESHPYFIDIDGDGDLDCFSGEYTNSGISKVYYYRNDGTNKHPVFKAIAGQDNPLDKAVANRLSIPYFIDIDGDGDYDCFIGEGATGAVVYYKNTGSATHPVFQKQSAAFNPLSMVKFSTSAVANPAFADIDGDGDYDCLIVDEAGSLNYFKNTGTATRPAFEHVDNEASPFKLLSSAGGIYNVSFEDWNKDGLIDLFINTAYYKNTGTKIKPRFDAGTDEPVFQNAPAAYKYTYTPLRWVDLDNDGKMEVVKGSAKGGFIYETLSQDKATTITAPVPGVSVRVAPNPSSNEFILNISPAAPSIIRVVDGQGKLLSTHVTGIGTVKFGTELQPGIYFLQVMQNNKVIYNQKIIKQ